MAKTKPLPAEKATAKDVRRLIAEQKPSSDSSALLNDIIDMWGGTRQFAKDLIGEFRLAPEGGMTRQRILEMIQRLVITNTQHELSRPKRAEDLDDADLDLVIANALGKMNANGGAQSQ